MCKECSWLLETAGILKRSAQYVWQHTVCFKYARYALLRLTEGITATSTLTYLQTPILKLLA